MAVPILWQGEVLLASIQAALTDRDLLQLRDELAAQIGRLRCRGVVIDVSALDVVDSFAARTLRGVAYVTRLRGAEAVIVGIQPDVAIGMVQLGLALDGVATALDLEEGLAYLRRVSNGGVVSLEVRVVIEHEGDIVTARQKGRELGAATGFASTDLTLIALAISEIARNIVTYVRRGEIILSPLDEAGRRGVLVVCRDAGPGIPDIELAMRDGYSTAKILGVGLPGARRVLDDFKLKSTVGLGTTVTMKKWLR